MKHAGETRSPYNVSVRSPAGKNHKEDLHVNKKGKGKAIPVTGREGP
jgi:hypothetical protein